MWLAAGLFLLSRALPAQGAAGAGPTTADTIVVGLDSLLRIAQEQNLRLRAASAETRYAETLHTTAWSRFDPTVSVGGESNGNGVGAQLVGQLPTGGTYLVGSVAPSTLPGDPLYADAIVASIDQPVLRGLGLFSARNAIRAADAGVAASRSRLSRTRSEVAATVRIAYAILVERHRQEAIAERSLERARNLRDYYTKLRAIEKITKVDSTSAELGVASRHATLLQVQRERRDAEDALLFTVYGAGARAVIAHADGAVWWPRDTVFDAPDLPSTEDAIARALEARPDLEAARHDADQARYRSQLARNSALPTLNVSASFSSTRTDTLTGPGTAFGARYEDWRFGVVLSRPLWNAGAAAERDRATAAAEQTEVQLKEAENVVRQEVRSAVRDIKLARDQVAIAAEAARLANQQYDMERERLRLGLSDIFRVLQYEEQVGTVERAEAEAWLAYATARAQYRLAVGED